MVTCHPRALPRGHNQLRIVTRARAAVAAATAGAVAVEAAQVVPRLLAGIGGQAIRSEVGLMCVVFAMGKSAKAGGRRIGFGGYE